MKNAVIIYQNLEYTNVLIQLKWNQFQIRLALIIMSHEYLYEACVAMGKSFENWVCCLV